MSDIQSDLRRGADERDGESGQPQDHEGDQGAQTLQTLKHQAVTRLYIPDTQEMIAEEDNDGDGVITKEEFTKMLQKKNNSK